MSELLKINVNDHTERKNGLTYLSWAWAWAEVLKADPQATWEAEEYPQPDGTFMPCMYTGEGSAIVKVKVTIKGKKQSCWLPVMDHRNKAIKNPDAFAINTAIMRCLAKGIAMHGLGLYIYAGEDLPESDDQSEPVPEPVAKSVRSSPTMGEYEALLPEEQEYINDLAVEIVAMVASQQTQQAYARVETEHLDDSQKTALWSRLDSKTRAAIKRAGQQLKEAA